MSIEDSPQSPFERGQRVRSAARPEWGVGVIQRVQPAGPGAFRLEIQFASGFRVVTAPPAVLTPPDAPAAPQQTGWLDQLAGRTADERLRAIPDLGDALTPMSERLERAFALLRFQDTPEGLVGWARAQTGMPDPLTHWTRDDLQAAFADFAIRREAAIRELARMARRQDPRQLSAALARLAPGIRAEAQVLAG